MIRSEKSVKKEKTLIFALRKNIESLAFVICGLLRSKRALYLVYTSEEIVFLYLCQGVVVVGLSIFSPKVTIPNKMNKKVKPRCRSNEA